eukprot:scaffold2893_cov67-Cyclotella_meneghiniana.AAC.1
MQTRNTEIALAASKERRGNIRTSLVSDSTELESDNCPLLYTITLKISTPPTTDSNPPELTTPKQTSHHRWYPRKG